MLFFFLWLASFYGVFALPQHTLAPPDLDDEDPTVQAYYMVYKEHIPVAQLCRETAAVMQEFTRAVPPACGPGPYLLVARLFCHRAHSTVRMLFRVFKQCATTVCQLAALSCVCAAGVTVASCWFIFGSDVHLHSLEALALSSTHAQGPRHVQLCSCTGKASGACSCKDAAGGS